MSSFMDVFVGSKELKRKIVELSDSHEIPLRYICKEIQVDYKHFMQAYINSDSGNLSLTEYQAKRILSMLGIEVRTQFIINTEHDYKGVQQMLKEKHGYDHWSEKEKGAGASAEGINNFPDIIE